MNVSAKATAKTSLYLFLPLSKTIRVPQKTGSAQCGKAR
nr:MAG TPA: hypothetical protein [Caudoviricetes sp.]